jgi:hypothetical protein
MKTVKASDQPHGKLSERLAWASAATLAAAALTFGFILLHRENPLPAPVRFTVDTPGNGSVPLFGRPTVSPDGQSVLFAVADPASHSPVWYLYNLASRTSRAVPGTEDTTAVYWSFDSHSILLSRSNVFWRMDLNAGSPQRLSVVGAYSSWQPEGIVAGGRQGLRWFRPDGSGLRWIKRSDETDGKAYSYPSLIPGGRWMMYNIAEGDGFSVQFASLDGNVAREILKAEHPAIYTGPGYLLFRRGDMLAAQPVDPKSGELRGASILIAGPIGIAAGTIDLLGSFSASDNGVLVFRSDVKEAPNSFTVIVNWPWLLKKK